MLRLAVADTARGQGIGRKLWRACSANYPGTSRWRLEPQPTIRPPSPLLLTAVIPTWSRRGVGSWVKAELMRLAVRDGVPGVSTHTMRPILALNEASGFRSIARIASLRRTP